MTGNDIHVYDGFKHCLFGAVDVWHVHWPEAPLNASGIINKIIGITKLLMKLLICKIWMIKIVWTVHNITPHEYDNNRMVYFFYLVLSYLCDGFIFLSDHSYKEFTLRYRKITNVAIIPHGHYKDYITRFSEQYNVKKTRTKNLLYFGQIREYKNIPKLIEVHNDSANTKYTLLVAGSVHSNELKNKILDKIKDTKKSVIFKDKFLTDAELLEACRHSCAVILPYEKITNSGSLLYALSVNLPVIIPYNEAFLEIQNEVGKNWIKMYHPPLSVEIYNDCIEWVELSNRNTGPKLDMYDWPKIASETVKFYQKLTKKFTE